MSAARNYFSRYLQFTYTWCVPEIKELCATKKSGQCVESSRFRTSFDGKSYIWQIELYPNGLSEQEEGYISLFVVLLDGAKSSLRGSYVVSLIDKHYQGTRVEESDEISFKKDKGLGHPKYIKLNIEALEADGILNNDTITVQYKLNLWAPAFKPTDQVNQNGVPVPDNRITERMKILFADLETEQNMGSGFDIVITSSEGHDFYCHRDILNDVSQELRNFLNSKLQQSEVVSDENDVVMEAELEKTNANSLREVLRYIYCGYANIDDKNIEDIHEIVVLCKEWAVKEVLQQSENNLVQQMSLHNACRSYVIAYENKMSKLKEVSMTMIVSNMNKMPQSSGWAELIKQPAMLTEIFNYGSIDSASFTGLAMPQLPTETRARSEEVSVVDTVQTEANRPAGRVRSARRHRRQEKETFPPIDHNNKQHSNSYSEDTYRRHLRKK